MGVCQHTETTHQLSSDCDWNIPKSWFNSNLKLIEKIPLRPLKEQFTKKWKFSHHLYSLPWRWKVGWSFLLLVLKCKQTTQKKSQINLKRHYFNCFLFVFKLKSTSDTALLTICSSEDLGECCHAVLLWSSRTVLFAQLWVDNDSIFILGWAVPLTTLITAMASTTCSSYATPAKSYEYLKFEFCELISNVWKKLIRTSATSATDLKQHIELKCPSRLGKYLRVITYKG